jgi:hypothetical protein
MAIENGKNPKRPFDMAVSDYCDTSDDLLWRKHVGDQEKPKNSDIEDYHWYLTKRTPPYLRKRNADSKRTKQFPADVLRGTISS